MQLPGGDFGPVTAQNHNVYESMISPYVLRRQIEACLENDPIDGAIQFVPLPANLAPAGLNPTENLLGYKTRTSPWHREALTLYANTNDARPTANGLASRLCFNPILWAKCDSAIMSLGRKMNVVQGLPPLTSGVRSVGTTIVNEDGQLTTLLRRTDGRLTSTYPLDPATLAQSAMYTYRRKRVPEVPGTCYLTEEEEVPQGWLATINSSYEIRIP